jgi:hypothetical protein
MSSDAPQTQPSTDTAAASASASASAPTIVARPSHHWRDYRAKRLALSVMLVIFGIAFAYDGFVGWPRQNERIAELGRQIEDARKNGDDRKVSELDAERSHIKLHSDMDLLMQKVLAFVLIPGGVALLAWSFYQSRGEYRLADNVLHVPGHPPVPLDAVRAIDKTRWERKGIAQLDYELTGGQKGTVTLDDFVYQQRPTDDIFAHIERYTAIADDLDDLRAKVAALPQAYVTVGEYLFELTHDRGEPRDIVVNVFNVSDGKLAGKGIGRLPWAADAAAVKKALAGRFDDATPDEIAELVNICRTPPTQPSESSEDE